MDFNLPPTLPTSGGGGSGGAKLPETHLPSTSASEPAASSIADYMGGGSNRTMTSINDTSESATTSVAHAGEEQVPSDDPYALTEEERDEAWYEEGERARAEKAAANPSKGDDAYTLHTRGTGRHFKDTGKTGFDRRMQNYMRKHKPLFRNLDAENKELLHGIVTDRMRHKTTGSAINRRDRLAMRRAAAKAYRAESITREDYKDFKRVINRLQSD